MKTTLNKIRAQSPCGLRPNRDGTLEGLCKLMHFLGKTETDDELVSILTILESNGLDDALWCLRAVDGRDKEIRLLAVKFARQVQHLMKDERSLKALDVAEAFASGRATQQELEAARAAAWVAAEAAARATTGPAARATTGPAARAAAWVAAWVAAWAAAEAAAEAAAWGFAAWGFAAEVAAEAQQERLLRETCEECLSIETSI